MVRQETNSSISVISPYRAAFGINDVRMALVERARKSLIQHSLACVVEFDHLETTLRQVVGGRVLQSVISDREGLAHEVAEIVSSPVKINLGSG